MPTATLDERELADLTESIKSATAELNDARKKIEESNKTASALVPRMKELDALKDQGKEVSRELETTREKLNKLAIDMEGLSVKHTKLVETTREQMKSIGSKTDESEDGYVYKGDGSKGSLFKSKRQAQEIGVFILATASNGSNQGNRDRARRWLRENGRSLRYLPDIPQSMISAFGDEWTKQVTESMRQSNFPYAAQDLTTVAPPGAVLVWPEFVQTLIRNVEEHGRFRQNATVWPMQSGITYLPRWKAGFPYPEWEGEGDTIATQDPDVDMLQMIAKKMAILTQHSNELSMDNVISVADIVMFGIALAFASEEDRIGFNGTGAGGKGPTGYAGFVGVLGSARNGDTDATPFAVTGAIPNDLTTEITEAKLRAMTGLLHSWAVPNAKFYTHRSVHADLDGISNANGPVVKYQDGKTATIMGAPIVDVDQMPISPGAASTAVLAYGDLRKSWYLGDRRAPEIVTSEHFLFNKDLLAIRATQRIGIRAVQGNGMVVYVTGLAS
jgi:HK97 family phage major capsid protein